LREGSRRIGNGMEVNLLPHKGRKVNEGKTKPEVKLASVRPLNDKSKLVKLTRLLHPTSKSAMLLM
jgi:hypothetical protein